MTVEHGYGAENDPGSGSRPDDRAHEVYPLAVEQGLRVGRALVAGTAGEVDEVGDETDASTAS